MAGFNPNDPYQKAQMNALANIYDAMTSKQYNDDSVIPGERGDITPDQDLSAMIFPRPTDGTQQDIITKLKPWGIPSATAPVQNKGIDPDWTPDDGFPINDGNLIAIRKGLGLWIDPTGRNI